MSDRTCPECGAEIGPYDFRRCLTCVHPRSPSRWLTIADAALRVLELEPGPLKVYDIGRSIKRDLEMEVSPASLAVSLSINRRFCWAGKGMYGLYRHRLFPGPRALGATARFLLFAHGRQLDSEQLAFAMKNLGYRFQEQSLRIALGNEPNVVWPKANECAPMLDLSARTSLYRLGFAPSESEFQEILSRASILLQDGLEEYARRLGNNP